MGNWFWKKIDNDDEEEEEKGEKQEEEEEEEEEEEKPQKKVKKQTKEKKTTKEKKKKTKKGGKKDVEFINEDENVGDEGIDPDLLAELNKAEKANERSEKNKDYEKIKQGVEYGNGFTEEAQAAGDEFGALKPWMTNVVNTVPSNYKPSKLDGQTPDAQLELEFVHGYRCHDTRNNLKYTNNGDFVYHTAAVGIVYNKDTHTQSIYNEHFDDITALAIHPNKKYVATGEVGPYPLISIWDVETCKALVHIREPLQKGINHLAFSRDGKYLVATAADDDHNIAVFDWKKGQAENLSTITNKNLKVINHNVKDLLLVMLKEVEQIFLEYVLIKMVKK